MGGTTTSMSWDRPHPVPPPQGRRGRWGGRLAPITSASFFVASGLRRGRLPGMTGESYPRLQTFRHAQPAPWRQTRRCVQATAACSTGLVLPIAIWMLDGAIDMVASARGVSIATADRSATVPAVRSRRLGMRSSVILRSRETTRWRTLPDIGATPQCKRGDTRFEAASMDADGAWPCPAQQAVLGLSAERMALVRAPHFLGHSDK